MKKTTSEFQEILGILYDFRAQKQSYIDIARKYRISKRQIKYIRNKKKKNANFL